MLGGPRGLWRRYAGHLLGMLASKLLQGFGINERKAAGGLRVALQKGHLSVPPPFGTAVSEGAHARKHI